VNLNPYRTRAERGEVQLGTWITLTRMLTDSIEGVREMIALGATIINYASDATVLRAGYAAVVADLRQSA
jgi:hypothetical protein